MLGHTYRYQAYNSTGVSVTVTVKDRPFKFASDGSLDYAAAEATRINGVSVGAGAYSNSSTIDNSTDEHVGTDLTVTFAPASSATGLVSLYLQRSTDGGTTWPSNGQGRVICAHYFSASATSVTKNAEVR